MLISTQMPVSSLQSGRDYPPMTGPQTVVFTALTWTPLFFNPRNAGVVLQPRRTAFLTGVLLRSDFSPSAAQLVALDPTLPQIAELPAARHPR